MIFQKYLTEDVSETGLAGGYAFVFYKAALCPRTPWSPLPALLGSSALLEILVTLLELTDKADRNKHT